MITRVKSKSIIKAAQSILFITECDSFLTINEMNYHCKCDHFWCGIFGCAINFHCGFIW